MSEEEIIFDWLENPFFIDISNEVDDDYLLGSDGYIYEKPILENSDPEPIKYKYVTKDYKDKSYWKINDKYIDIDKLFARYFLPSTKLPTDPYWNTIQLEKNKYKGAYMLLKVKWAKPTARKGADLKEKYITKSGVYFQLRVASLKYNNRFKELKDAVSKRQELLGF